MRVIVNIQSIRGAKAFGWRAMEIHVNNDREACLDEILQAVKLKDERTMYEYLIKENRISEEWILYVNGVKMTGSIDLKAIVKDSTQIHLLANPNKSHHE